MKFNLIKNVIGAVAPTLGSALGGPLVGKRLQSLHKFFGVPQNLKQLVRQYKPQVQNKCLSLKKLKNNLKFK